MKHRDILFRVLYIYSSINQGMGYVQGMNELAAILYHCFFIYGDKDDRTYIEADTFWCFFSYLSPVRNLFDYF